MEMISQFEVGKTYLGAKGGRFTCIGKTAKYVTMKDRFGFRRRGEYIPLHNALHGWHEYVWLGRGWTDEIRSFEEVE